MYIKNQVKKVSQRACICNRPQCALISKEFRELNDIRGDYSKLSNPKENTRNNTKLSMLRAYNERIFKHHGINIASFETEYYNKARPMNVTRSNVNEQLKKDSYFALHHYHPLLLKIYGKDLAKAKNRFKDPQELKRLGLYDARGGSFYSKADLVKDRKGNDVVAIVPNYVSFEKVRTDLLDAQSSKKLAITINEARNEEIVRKRARECRGTISTSSLQNGRPPKRHLFDADVDLMNFDEVKSFVKKIQKESKSHYQDHQSALKENISFNQRLNNVEQINRHQHQKLKDENRSLSDRIEEFNTAGLTRLSMSNPKYFAKNKRACKDLYGFFDFDFLTHLIQDLLEVEYKVATTTTIKTNLGLTQFEQVLLTMLYTNTHHNYDTIGSVFGVECRQTVGTYIDKWMPVLGELGDMLSSFVDLLDPKAYDFLEPKSYKELNLRKVAAVIDGKDFLSETVRKDKVLNCAQSSNKSNHSAILTLTWSSTCGAVTERTPAIFGRTSEKSILRAWGDLGRLQFPKGYLILGDKGFDNTAGYYTNYNTTLHPAFLTHSQFSRNEVNFNLLICQKRYSCETVYSRVAQLKKLSGIIQREHFKHFDDILGWGHGLANIGYGYLQKIDGYHC